MELSSWIYIIIFLALFCGSTAQTYAANNQGLATFPSNISNDTKEISLDSNDISSFPDDSFTKFYQLESLSLATNPFTVLPNLRPVGNTLMFLDIMSCQLTELDASIFNELRVLKELKMGFCKLTSFPDVPGPGNTLSLISCKECKLTEFPMLSNYKVLTNVNLRGAPIAKIPEAAIASMHLQGTLKLHETVVTSLPDYPISYENITDLDLRDTAVTIVPLMCPRYNLTVEVKWTNVTMCNCKNLWLRALDGHRGSVSINDLSCGTATTTEELLLQQCQRPVTGIRTFKASLKHEDFLCQFPVHTYTRTESRLECVLMCIHTLGCSSIGFQQTKGRKGNCVIIAPTDTALNANDILDSNNQGWDYITVE